MGLVGIDKSCLVYLLMRDYVVLWSLCLLLDGTWCAWLSNVFDVQRYVKCRESLVG